MFEEMMTNDRYLQQPFNHLFDYLKIYFKLKGEKTLPRKSRERLIFFSLAIGLSSSAPAQHPASNSFWEQDVWTQKERGFLFYEPNSEKKKSGAKTKLSELPSPLHFDSIDELRQEKDRRLAAAVMDPSPDNMQRYLQINALMLEKSSAFADAWRRTLWAHPQYDFTRAWPSANFAQLTVQRQKEDQQTRSLAALREDWGLIFVVREGCPFCDVMAPIAEKLKNALHMPILAVYIGQTRPAAWPEAKPDNGIVAVLAQRTREPVRVTPSLFMLNKHDESVRRVSDGALSLAELLKRLYVIAAVPAGEGAFHAIDGSHLR